MPRAQVDRQLADQSPEQVTEAQARRHRPQQPVQGPVADPAGRQAALFDQQQAEDDEGKGGAVVEAGLAGQPVAHVVAVTRVVDLHQAGEHRVGGCEDGADQHGDAPGQPEEVMTERGDPGDAGQHHRPGQHVGALPGRVAQRHAQLQTADEQRHQHGDFGEVLHPAGDVQEFHFPQADAELADQQAEAQVDQRGGDRQPAQIGRCQREDQQQDAENGHPFEKAHGGFRWRGVRCPEAV